VTSEDVSRSEISNVDADTSSVDDDTTLLVLPPLDLAFVFAFVFDFFFLVIFAVAFVSPVVFIVVVDEGSVPRSEEEDAMN
jgi:hypothetical protein